MNKIINNTRGSFIVDYKLMIILLLVLITIYFGLIAGWLRFILLWEIELINFISLLNVSFLNWNIFLFMFIIIIVLYRISSLKNKKLYLKKKYKKNIILKRFYTNSNINYNNPFLKKLASEFFNLKKGHIVTKNTIYNITKKSKEISSYIKIKSFYENNNLDSILFKHYSNINGGYFTENNIIKVLLFTPFTTKNEHICYIDKKEFYHIEKNININIKDWNLKMPTLKTDIKTQYENLNLPNKSIIKTYIPENITISVKEDEIFELDLERALEIQLKEKKVMEILEKKDYEFINKDNELYLVHKNFIKKEENLIVKVDFNNAERVTVEEFIKLGYKIANINKLYKYLNISQELKNDYLRFYEEYFKYIKMIKK